MTIELLLALDFEATCAEPQNPDPQEIIEFPIVLVDAKDPNKEPEVLFRSFVRPVHHPELSDFCKELTKITQEQVDAAPTFPEVFEKVKSVLLERTEGKTFAFVTFGHWDLNTALPAQLKASELAELPADDPFRQWINIRQAFAKFTNGSKPDKIPEMLSSLGATFEGQLHSGLDDAKGIAAAVREMLARGWEPEINGSLDYKATSSSSSSPSKQYDVLVKHPPTTSDSNSDKEEEIFAAAPPASSTGLLHETTVTIFPNGLFVAQDGPVVVEPDLHHGQQTDIGIYTRPSL